MATGLEGKTTRRELLASGAALGGVLLLGGCSEDKAGPPPIARRLQRRRSEARVLIVGAGLAGLTCAHRLQGEGVDATVIEANAERVGGRCWTLRELGGPQVAEHGGEFIDSRHHAIRRLVTELGLELTDLEEGKPKGVTGRTWFDGRLRKSGDVYAGLPGMVAALERERRRIGPYDAGRAGRAARAFDEMTAAEWLDDNVDRSLLREAIEIWMSGEFGLDTRELSAINLIENFAAPYPGADERYHVSGGNDQITERLADGLADGALVMDAPLESLRVIGSEIEAGVRGRSEPIVADRVVLALPFTTLREVDLGDSGLTAKRRRAIDELGMGTNSKQHLRLDRHPRALDRWSGTMTMDAPQAQLTWDSTRGEPGRGGLITIWRGGRDGTSYPVSTPHGPAPPAEAKRALRAIERGVPGIEAAYAGDSWIDQWADDPHTRGSYAAFLPGQYTRYWTYLGRPEGRYHFAGEHTSTRSQGYLDGAVESGERAADEVLTSVDHARS